MVREEKLNIKQLTGSYAGAMGMPQFIPSSFRSYAVDFDGNGVRDFWNGSADSIGSVANYFKRHGWKLGEPVVARVEVSDTASALGNRKMKPHIGCRFQAGRGQNTGCFCRSGAGYTVKTGCNRW